ncbi:MAG TPA: cytochrome P450 [Pyrinomonadaceae bacterium]|nr:cytochrome P450 [Pyrinomonadaceae bacterium]
MSLPPTIPRVAQLRDFYDDPLTFFGQARAELGDMFVLREDAPLFSRSPECSGVIAVFGAGNHQAVLTDSDLFSLPISAAQHLSLPDRLINLNRGLHSMRGEQHDQHQRLILRVLGDRNLDDRHRAITAVVQKFVSRWQHGQKVGLLTEMRRLTFEISSRYLFGERYDDGATVAALAEKFFHSRRELTSAFSTPSEASLKGLVALGTSLDEAMRKHIRWSRQQTVAPADGLLAKLASLEVRPGTGLSEDEMVGHGNVLFMSSNEPIAVALTWTLLVLSQLPELRQELRNELDQWPAEIVPSLSALSGLTLLDAVISESLRLLTPNAMMSRVTSRAGSLNGVLLPAHCEIVICPLLAHRDETVFPSPKEFLPSRWRGFKPSPFEYFPFGAGGHSCVGRSLALHVIKAALAVALREHQLVLDGDQEIDWQVHIIFMPVKDPIMRLVGPATKNVKAGKLLGPLRDLIQL